MKLIRITTRIAAHLFTATFVSLAITWPMHAEVSPSGAFVHRIPIDLPPGINGVQPSLSIDYNSQSKGLDSYVGISWQLNGLSEIKRVNIGNGINYDGHDSYMSPEGLLIDNGDGSYSSLNQNYSRYVPQGQCGDSFCSWTVYLANGSKQYYGQTVDSRVIALNHPGSVQIWAISKSESAAGLYWEAEYNQVGDGQYYPLRIAYTKGSGLYFHVTSFEYAIRSDTFLQYSRSGATSTTRLLKAVETKVECLVNFCGFGTSVNRWLFSHEQSRNVGAMKLIGVTQHSYDGHNAIDSTLTRTRLFKYEKDDSTVSSLSVSPGQYKRTGFCDWVAIHYPSSSNCFDYLQGYGAPFEWYLSDPDGDGRQDLTQIWSNASGHAIRYPAPWGPNFEGVQAFWNLSVTHPYAMPNPEPAAITLVANLNKDQTSDYVALTLARIIAPNTPWRLLVWTATSDAEGTQSGNGGTSILPNYPEFGPVPQVPDKEFKHKYQLTSWIPAMDGNSDIFLTGDIDGDGQKDLYYLFKLAGGQVRINMLISDGLGTFTERTTDSSLISSWDSNTSVWQVGDFDGDRKEDLLLWTRHGNNFRANWAFSNGDGTFRYQTTDTDIAGHWDNANDILRNADVNGDGLLDVILITNENGKARIYFLVSKGNGQFEITQQETDISPTWNSLTSLWLPADINGDGRTDLYALINIAGQLRVYTLISRGIGGFIIDSTDTGIYPFWDGVRERWFAGDFDGDGAADVARVFANLYDSDYLMQRVSRVDSIRSKHTFPVLTQIEENDTVAKITYEIKATVKDAVQVRSKSCGVSQSGPVCGVPNGTPQLIVVTESVASLGSTKSTKYEYANGRSFISDLLRSTDAGFEWIKQTDNQTGAWVQTYYNQTKPFIGTTAKIVKSTADGKFQSIQEFSDYRQYACNDTGCTRNDTPDLLQPRIVRVGSQRHDTYDDKGVHLVKTRQITYDIYGSQATVVETASGNGTSNSITTDITFNYNFSATTRFVGIPALKRQCLGVDCTGTILSQIRYSYDGLPHGQVGNLALLTQKEDWLSGDTWITESFAYDGIGNLITKTNQSGIITAIIYDNDYKAYPIQVTVTSQGVSRTTSQQIDPRFGMPISQSDVAGVTTSKILDGKGRPLSIEIRDQTSKLLRKTSYTYHLETAGDKYTETCMHYLSDFSARSCSRKYIDGFGRVIREISPAAQGTQSAFLVKIYGYDTQGRKISESESLFAGDLTGQVNPSRFTVYTYDGLSRIVTVTAPDARVTTHSYNDDLIPGSVESEATTKPDGVKKKVYRDIAGNVIRVVQAQGTTEQSTVDYVYDPLGRLTNVHSAQGTTTISYDPQYRWQVSITDPNVGKTEYTYVTTLNSPAFGHVATETRPDANTITSNVSTTTFSYNDAWGRLTNVQRADGTTTSYIYDQTDVAYGTDALTTRVHNSGGFIISERFAYDALGGLATTTRHISNTSYALCADANDLPCTSVVSSEQDELGRTRAIGYADGRQTAMSYIGGTSAVHQIAHDSKMYIEYSGYNQWGKPESIRYGNGIDHSYTYDSDTGVLEGVTVTRAAQTFLNLSYCYDLNLHVSRLIDSVVPGNSANYTFDALGRISSSARGIPQQDCSPYGGASQVYSFDSGGAYGTKGTLVVKNNRKLLYAGSGIQPSGDQIWDKDAGVWVENQAFTWSASGNLLSKGLAHYQYDANNMMSHASEPTTGDTDFYYDADGQRFLKVFKRSGENPIRTWYLQGGLEVRQRTSADLTAVYSYQMTKYIQSSSGQKIASVTGGLNESLAFASGRYSMMAKAYSGDTVTGLLNIIQYDFHAFVSDAASLRKTYIGILLLIAAALAWWLLRGWSAQSIAYRTGRYGLFSRSVAVTIALIFFSVNMNCVGRSDVEMNPLFQTPGGPSGAIDFSSVYGGLPAGTYYYHPDHLGSGSLITNAAGGEVLRIVYDAYGNIDQFASGKLNQDTGEIEQDVGELSVLILAAKFTGQEYDPETGFYYYNARYYDPNVGVFTTADTEVPNPLSAHSYNRYMYVAGNPINMIDPTGHWEFSFGFDSNGGGTFTLDLGPGNGSGGGHIGGILPTGGSAPVNTPVGSFGGGQYAGGDYAGYSGGYGNIGTGGGSGGVLSGAPLIGHFFMNQTSFDSMSRFTPEAGTRSSFSWDNLPREDKIVLGVAAGIVVGAAVIAAAPAVAATAAAFGPASTSTFFATGGMSLLGAGAVAGTRVVSQVQGQAAAIEAEVAATSIGILRGSQNPTVREAIQRGQEAHQLLRTRILEKGNGWQSEPLMRGVSGRLFRPDVVTPSGRILELKPMTSSGIYKGLRQLKLYEQELQMPGRLIFYK